MNSDTSPITSDFVNNYADPVYRYKLFYYSVSVFLYLIYNVFDDLLLLALLICFSVHQNYHYNEHDFKQSNARPNNNL